jgi:tetratricopeptide (TPR) repeat protein
VAGKRKVFEQSLREAHNLAWDGKWDEAITAYQRALHEFPNDAAARNNLAQALIAAGRLDDALAEYREVAALSLDDPAPLLHLAELHEKRGEVDDAVGQYNAAATILETRGDVAQAVGLLERAVKLAPAHLGSRERLAVRYIEAGKRNAAVEQYLALARAYQQRGQPEKAVRQIQVALQVNPRSLEARQALEGLRQGSQTVTAETPRLVTDEQEMTRKVGPVETARQRLLSELALAIFERGEESALGAGDTQAAATAEHRARINALLGQAIDFQSRGLIDDAISSYVRALEAGADNGAIHFGLGLLYQEKSLYDEAIEHLTLSARDAQYAVASEFALGECYRAGNRLDDALKHFFRVVQSIDLQHARSATTADLTQMYNAQARIYLDSRDVDRAMVFMSSVVDFFSSSDWEDKVTRARRRLDNLGENGFLTSLVELLAVPAPDLVLDAIGASHEYSKQRMYRTASEECFRAVTQAPAYLPLHVRLASILVLQGEIESAVEKYLIIAETYLARGERKHALHVYQQVLQLAPMDVNVRGKHIDLLVEMGDLDVALEESLAVADSYYHMARIDLAVSTYEEALRLLPRTRDRDTWEPRILHLLADIYVQSVDWIKARNLYERIVTLAPDDDRARRRLVDLSFKLEDNRTGLRQLDELLRQYAASGRTDEALAFLRELVESWPRAVDLRARLTDLYLSRDMTSEAVASLNVLGELQLDAGQQEAAAKTIRQLAKLEPEKGEDYRDLLNQLLSSRDSGGGGRQ